MLKSLGFCLALSCSALVTAAPPTVESVEALLSASKVEKIIDATYANIGQIMRQAMQTGLQGKKLSAGQQRVFDGMPEKLMKALTDEMNWEEMKPLYVQVYREGFEQEDVDGLLAF